MFSINLEEVTIGERLSKPGREEIMSEKVDSENNKYKAKRTESLLKA